MNSKGRAQNHYLGAEGEIMKKRTLFWFSFILGLILLITYSAVAQRSSSKKKTRSDRITQGPTLQETLEWLDNNFNFGNSSQAMQLISPPDEKRFFYSVGHFKGCTVKWFNNESRIKDGVTTVVSTETLTVDLATIDPDKVIVEDHKVDWMVEMRTTNDVQKIRSQLWMSSRASPDGLEASQDVVTNGASFVVSDQRRGEKMRSAFQNAIRLCGGKKSTRF